RETVKEGIGSDAPNDVVVRRGVAAALARDLLIEMKSVVRIDDGIVVDRRHRGVLHGDAGLHTVDDAIADRDILRRLADGNALVEAEIVDQAVLEDDTAGGRSV